MKLGTIAIPMLIAIVVIGTGWVKNIIKLTELDFEAPYKAEVIRVVGIFPPVGMIVGYMDIEDKATDDPED